MRKTIDEHWKHYLSLLGINPDLLPQIQKDEMQKSFYAGASSMLEMMRDVSETHGMDEAALIFEDVLQEAFKFWKDRLGHPN